MYPKLVEKRKEKGYSQTDMAKMLGIHKNIYNKKENGKLDFWLTEVIKILKILGCKYQDIFD